MKNLLKWELKQTFNSKAFWGFGIAFIIGILLFMIVSLSDGNKTGFELYLQNCSNFNSLVVLVLGVYSGIHIAGAFEERKVQASVMAGNSRLNIIMTKLLIFSLVIALFAIVSITISSTFGFLMAKESGIQDNFFREVILRTGIFTIVEISFASICFVISMVVKNLGGSIAISLIALIALNGVGQSLLGKTWAEGFMKFTSIGQTFLVIGQDATVSNLFISTVAALIGIALAIIVSYVTFRKEELK